MTSEPYERLVGHARETALLDSVAAVLSWDQETMLPAGGVEHRARQLAQLARLRHEMAVRPEVGDWLQACEQDDALLADRAGVAAVNVRELRRGYDRETKLPAALVAEIAEVTSLAQHEWTQARAASDFPRFRPWLDRLVGLMRQKAGCLGVPAGGEPWDALLDGFEPGATARELEALFAPIRARSTALIELVRSRPAPPSRFAKLELPVEAQEAFVRFVVEQLGFDFRRGRLDRSTHPFTIGVHCTDVRLTTRFGPTNVLDALGATMHEAGHGLYEQGVLAAHFGTPMGAPVSLGVHESQSRLWENHVGASHAFWTWCQPHLERFFGRAVRGFGADEIWRTANRIEPGFIRVEADEASYDLHVMVRFELELALLRGEFDAADVPAAWNRAYESYLGLRVPDDRRGCLQDVHWSCGLFGYFPTYTLGNLYAAQLFAKAREELSDLEQQIAAGSFAPLRRWLNEKVHAPGQRWRAAELCEVVTGAPLSAEPLLAHLERKVADVYGPS